VYLYIFLFAAASAAPPADLLLLLRPSLWWHSLHWQRWRSRFLWASQRSIWWSASSEPTPGRNSFHSCMQQLAHDNVFYRRRGATSANYVHQEVFWSREFVCWLVGSFVRSFLTLSVSKSPIFTKFGTDVSASAPNVTTDFWEAKVNVQGHLCRVRPTRHGDAQT